MASGSRWEALVTTLPAERALFYSVQAHPKSSDSVMTSLADPPQACKTLADGSAWEATVQQSYDDLMRVVEKRIVKCCYDSGKDMVNSKKVVRAYLKTHRLRFVTCSMGSRP